MQRKRGCGIIIKDSDNRILMGQRVKKGDKLQWCLPGGKVEENESAIQGAVREVREECGLIIKEEDLILIEVTTAGEWDDFVFYTNKYTGSVSDNTEEMINFKWFNASDICNMDKEKDIFPATIKSLIALSHYNSNSKGE